VHPVSAGRPQRRFLVHRWTATELAARAAPANSPGLGQAHEGSLPERFTSLLSQATGDTSLTEAIMYLLDEFHAAETEGSWALV
jgi:hypothetical protein